MEERRSIEISRLNKRMRKINKICVVSEDSYLCWAFTRNFLRAQQL